MEIKINSQYKCTCFAIGLNVKTYSNFCTHRMREHSHSSYYFNNSYILIISFKTYLVLIFIVLILQKVYNKSELEMQLVINYFLEILSLIQTYFRNNM